MEHLSNIPIVGWIVIAFIAILTFILLMKKGIRFGIGDKKIIVGAVGKEVDGKLESFKNEIEKKESDRLKDEELRKKLFRQIGEIDEKTKADECRIVRKINSAIKDIFTQFVKCEMPMLSVVELIKDILQERVDYNNMRERLTAMERKGYITDILYFIETDYKTFLHKLPAVPCGTEQYPAWGEIAPQVEKIVNEWADKMIEIMKIRINEKIEMYMSEKDNFILPEYRELCIDFPVRKNKKYIKNLQ